ncbi:uncharacterized protein LOC134541040 [Bacillus rossius redtenbacheri]|uniref:uncharacterized protein LOC134541040 n=1 Tax=Bacillus rossius redtenbacheri TaxID=93214 RepID=UPI002FDC7BFB
MERNRAVILVAVAVLSLLPSLSQGLLKRCFSCRSRGERGSCKDPFRFNLTTVEPEQGLEAVPCASGWCGKFMEGGAAFKEDDYDMATERLCLPRGPSDSEERCAYTSRNHKKVYMCFCQGDLCNSAPARRARLPAWLLPLLPLLSLLSPVTTFL